MLKKSYIPTLFISQASQVSEITQFLLGLVVIYNK